MLVENRLTVERCNTLGVLLGDSCIMEEVACLSDVKDPSMILC